MCFEYASSNMLEHSEYGASNMLDRRLAVSLLANIKPSVRTAQRVIINEISPGVPPSRAAFAPVNVSKPPSDRKLDASLAASTELCTLCLIIRSVFLTKSVRVVGGKPKREEPINAMTA